MSSPTTAPLRVAYVVKTYPRLSETFILNEILALEARGVDVTILALKRPAESRFHEKLARVRGDVLYAPDVRSNAMIEFLTARLPRLEGREESISRLFWEALRSRNREALETLPAALAFLAIVRERGIRHLHAHFATSAAALARQLADLAGVTYSFTAHAKDIFHDSVRLPVLREKAESAAFVVAVSDFSADFLRERLGPVAATRVQRLYNGLDLSEFPRPDAREGHDRTASVPTLLSVGRLVEKKGFPVLIEAVARLRNLGRPVRLVIAGEGEQRAELEAQIRSLRLQESVELVGALSHGDIRAWMTRADLFVLAAQVADDGNRDGLPVVVVEAMAAGLPVVSTPIVGIPEAVVDGVTGRLVPEKDAATLAAALVELLEDRNRAAAMARAARVRVEEQFDGARSAATLEGAFRRAAGVELPLELVG